MKRSSKTLISNNEWWRNAIICETYVRSFLDSNGDGEGDILGIAAGLDYLEQLGVDAIWLPPISPSPNLDSGYDVSDYYVSEQKLGSLDDLKELVRQAHARDIRVILDQVYSHSSHLHPWFTETLGWWPAEPAHGALAISIQEPDDDSALCHMRKLIALRRQVAALRLGSWEVLDAAATRLVFRREHDAEIVICGFNWGREGVPFESSGERLAGSAESGVISCDGYAIVRVPA